jgi:membrane associated rhomboid family serine protease
MFALYLFGADLERLMGPRYYLALYFVAVLAAACAQLAVATAAASGGSVYPTVGASGGVFGILLAFGLLFPDRTVMLLFPPIPMPARVFVLLYGAFELMNGIMSTRAGVAHFAHLGGMLGGYLALVFWRRRRPGRSWPA